MIGSYFNAVILATDDAYVCLGFAALLLPVLVSSAAWIGFFYIVYGTPDPTVPYGASADFAVRLSNLPRSLLGLLADQ